MDFQEKSDRIAALRAKGAPVSYEIVINEDQRIALLKLLQDTNADCEEGPLDYWEGMLADLPEIEAESPGILHGFCL